MNTEGCLKWHIVSTTKRTHVWHFSHHSSSFVLNLFVMCLAHFINGFLVVHMCKWIVMAFVQNFSLSNCWLYRSWLGHMVSYLSQGTMDDEVWILQQVMCCSVTDAAEKEGMPTLLSLLKWVLTAVKGFFIIVVPLI